MIQGLYSAASALVASQTKGNVRANNIANVSTNGYKARVAILSELSKGGVNVLSVKQNEDVGYLISTGRALDLAVNGEGNFSLNGGDFLTRAGAFQRNANGNIVDPEGRVLMANVPEGQMSIDTDGTVLVNGQQVGQIELVDNGGNPVPQNAYELMSGFLEASNVNAAKEIIGTMTNQRYFELNAATVKTTDSMLGSILDLKG